MARATKANATVTAPTMAIVTTRVPVANADRLRGFAAAGSSSGAERWESPPRTTAAPGTAAVVAECDELPGTAAVAGCDVRRVRWSTPAATNRFRERAAPAAWWRPREPAR